MSITYSNIHVTKVLTLRGNTIQNNRYTGLPGELTVDTEAKTIRIHDGVTAGGNIVSGGGGGTSYTNANVHSYLTSFDGNIIPSANTVFSLGSITNQWKSLYVSSNTIYINGIPLSINGSGNLVINGNELSKGDTGATGNTGPQGLRGNIGPQGPQGNVGPQGPQGIQGIQGNTGPQGIQGIQGNTGPQGSQGVQGIQGNVGAQGSTGAQGIQGNVGPQGSQGIQGIQGNIGATGPRGFTGNTGEQGPQGERGLTGNTGAQGVSVTLKGSVEFVANLPMTGNAGEGWIVQGDGNLYIWNSTTVHWDDIGQIVGPQGDPGPQGPRGFTGNVGAQGPQGDTGPAGPQGTQGIQGNVGPQGIQGIQGNVGLQGPQGEQGMQGIQGNTGPQGSQGIQGNVGPQGPTGAQGIQGNTGTNGTNGQDGIGVSTATVTAGNLIITLTDASQINAGNVVGPQGPQGIQGPTGSGSTIEVSQISGSNVANVISSVSALRFDTDTGFNVEDLGSGAVKVSLGSSFKTWTVDGQDSLVAQGEDTVEFVAGTGVIITTQNTAPKSITISADSLVNLDGGSAGTVYDTPVVYADGGGASTRFGVNSTSFDGNTATPGTIDYNLNGGRA